MDELFYPGDIEDIAGSGKGAEGLGDVVGFADIIKAQNPLSELRKALEAGYGTGPDTQTGGGALRIESLEPNLKNLTYTEESTTLINDLLKDKKKAESTVEEYSTIDEIGEAFTFGEGGLPASEDDYYSRRYELIKYVGSVGQVSNPMLAVRPLAPAREREIKSKMLAIKRKLDILSYFGDKTLVSTEFNGLLAAVIQAGLSESTGHIIDLRGYQPRLEDFNQGIQVLENITGYTGNVRCYLSPFAKNQYKATLLKDKRYVVGGGVKSTRDAEIEGLKANLIIHDDGEAPIRKDIFLNPRKYPRRNRDNNAFMAIGSTPPAVPTITASNGGVHTEPVADTASRLEAGVYDWAIVAVNKYGHKSTPSEDAHIQNITIAANEKMMFTVVDGGSGSGLTATAFEVYRRSHADSGTPTAYRYLFTVAAGSAFYDDGTYMPDTGYMFLVDWDTDQVLAYHQLLDAALFPLGPTADAIRWIQRVYGALLVYNPKKIVVIQNVGSAVTS